MQVKDLAIPALKLITPKRFSDPRGFFSETYNAARFAEAGIADPFVQDNQSLSRDAGVVRGLHCQIGAAAQGKLVRCVRGAIWDVAVDIRRGSPTYGQYCAAELNADNWQQLWIPPGFLHGFCTIATDTEVIYKVTAPYDPASERGVMWDDPTLTLPWPVAPGLALLSAKDLRLGPFAAAEGWFPAGSAAWVRVGRGPVMVAGGAGQLATALRRAGDEPGMTVVGRPLLDFDRPESIDAAFAAIRPGLVVNAAAWTAVDLAESQPGAAGRVNRDGPARLAMLCARAGIPLIHVSTDYVFDGCKGAPYIETDPPCPTGVYGRTKLEGEQAVLGAWPGSIVLRTSWVYSAGGKNFVRTMLGLAGKAPTLRVVADQHGCPTAAADLAQAILSVIALLRDGWQDRYTGVTHAAGAGSTSWHGLAVATFAAAARHGRSVPQVEPIATADWPTPAMRPPDSRLDCARLADIFGIRLPDWRPSLDRTVAEMMNFQPDEPPRAD